MWRGALAIWAGMAVLALILWLPVASRSPRQPIGLEVYMPRRSRQAWTAAGLFGLQSIIYYGVLTWLAPLYEDAVGRRHKLDCCSRSSRRCRWSVRSRLPCWCSGPGGWPTACESLRWCWYWASSSSPLVLCPFRGYGWSSWALAQAGSFPDAHRAACDDVQHRRGTQPDGIDALLRIPAGRYRSLCRQHSAQSLWRLRNALRAPCHPRSASVLTRRPGGKRVAPNVIRLVVSLVPRTLSAELAVGVAASMRHAVGGSEQPNRIHRLISMAPLDMCQRWLET